MHDSADLRNQLDRCIADLAAVVTERDDLKRYLEAAATDALRAEREIAAYRAELSRSFAFSAEREATIADLQRRLLRMQRVSSEGRERVEIERDAQTTTSLAEKRRARLEELNQRVRSIVATKRELPTDVDRGDS